MDDVADHEELGVELGRPIFEDMDTALEQPPISVARRRDGGVVVGFRCGDDPDLPAPAGDAGEPAKHSEAGREIGGDEVQLPGALHVAADGAGPGA